MKIAISSGKGGVGKTLAASCLASVMADQQKVCYADCDVEAPNGHLFLKPDPMESADEFLECIERIDLQTCTFCGHCVKACYFNALAVGKKTAISFPELCRGCGACLQVCPTNALIPGQRRIGTRYQGQAGAIQLHWATLATGAGGMTVRLIEQLKDRTKHQPLVILDSPPGTSCSAVHTIRGADQVVLITDPTRFGWHDFTLSVHLCRSMAIEPLAIINRAQLGDPAGLRQWCTEHRIHILAELPDSRTIAELYSKGIIPVTHIPSLRQQFTAIANELLGRVSQSPAALKPDLALEWQIRPAEPDKTDIPAEAVQAPAEIAVVSGKGGTGKTSLCACFAQLVQSTAADCDVDAADMHLLLEPQVLDSTAFCGGRTMQIDPAVCLRCGRCAETCRWKAIHKTDDGSFTVAEEDCEGCGACLQVCPVNAFSVHPTVDGQWYWSSIRFGWMSHAILEPGKDNSGKLVTLVRKEAVRRTRSQNRRNPILIDGSPGTGCPVIASIGGTAATVIVTEPTVSGLHDMQRILELIHHFRIRACVIINKADLNLDITEAIKKAAAAYPASIVGQLPYNLAFVHAQQAGKTMLEYQPDSKLSEMIRSIWKQIQLLTLNGKQV